MVQFIVQTNNEALLSSGDSFPHLIQKRRSQLGFITYLLNYPRIILEYATKPQRGSKAAVAKAEPWQRPVTTWVYKPEAADTVQSS
jgi:hypothetical protein